MRLNYKNCREKVFNLLDKKSIFTKEEIWNVLELNENMDYYKDYVRFSAFLHQTRNLAFREYLKAKKELVNISNIIFFRDLIKKGKGTVQEFIHFCENNRIPLLYYIPKIKKYVFPNELLLTPIISKLCLFSMKGLIDNLKRMERFGFYINVEEIINKISNLIGKNEEMIYVKSFIRRYYIIGETKDMMLERIKYKEKIKKLNEEIDNNLYSISELELK